ncbi:hypothetical protein D9M70_633500 [compost metagenome]
MDHQVLVDRHDDQHPVNRVVGRNAAEQQLAVIRLGIAQPPFELEQAVLAQIARTGDLAGVQQAPFLNFRYVLRHRSLLLRQSGRPITACGLKGLPWPGATLVAERRPFHRYSERPTSSRWISLAPP